MKIPSVSTPTDNGSRSNRDADIADLLERQPGYRMCFGGKALVTYDRKLLGDYGLLPSDEIYKVFCWIALGGPPRLSPFFVSLKTADGIPLKGNWCTRLHRSAYEMLRRFPCESKDTSHFTLTLVYDPYYGLDPQSITARNFCIYNHKTAKRIECDVIVGPPEPGTMLFAVTLRPKVPKTTGDIWVVCMNDATGEVRQAIERDLCAARGQPKPEETHRFDMDGCFRLVAQDSVQAAREYVREALAFVV